MRFNKTLMWMYISLISVVVGGGILAGVFCAGMDDIKKTIDIGCQEIEENIDMANQDFKDMQQDFKHIDKSMDKSIEILKKRKNNDHD